MSSKQRKTIHFPGVDELAQALRTDFLSHLFYSKREVAEMLGVAQAKVEVLVEEGVLTEITLGESGGGISARDVFELSRRGK